MNTRVDQQRSYQWKVQIEIGTVHNWRMKVSTMHSDKKMQRMYTMTAKDFTLLLPLATFRIIHLHIHTGEYYKMYMAKKWNV
jgi:hypothetical protein